MHVTKNIPYSLALRLRRICCSDELFAKRLNELKIMLLSRQYRNKSIEAAFDKVRITTREDALKRVVKTKNDRPVFAVTYHPKLPAIPRIVKKHWKVMTGNSNLKEIFPQPPMIAYKQPKNLGMQLIKSVLPQKQRKSRKDDEKGFFKCKTPNCYVCKFAEPMKSIKSRNRQERIEIEIKSRLDCESKNLLYRIKCQKCGIEYIGETGRTAKERIREHLGYIRNHKPSADVNKSQPTGVHFNRKGHGLEYFSWCAFEKINNPSTGYRKARENFRIEQFNVIEPNGLNRE